MSRKLFVGGLSWGTTSEGLREAFSQYGEIDEAVVITDRDTGRSRGFGFVKYVDDSSTDKALSSMNGAMLDGRSIKVDIASSTPRDGGGGRDRRGFGGQRRQSF